MSAKNEDGGEQPQGDVCNNERLPDSWKAKLTKDPIALFTAMLTVATIALVIVGLLQWCTLVATDRTLKDTLEANRMTQRASLYLLGLSAEADYVEGSVVKRWAMIPVWKNGGSTGAPRFKAETYCIASPTEIDDPFPPSKAVLFNQVGTIGPAATRLGPWCIYGIDDAMIADINARKRFFYLAAQVCYLAVFDPTRWHVTQMSDQLRSLARDGNTLRFLPENRGRHNCTDEGCPDYKTACENN